jgi:hypothetical protein
VNGYDIETFLDENGMYIPYCICFNIKKRNYSVYYDHKYDIIKESLDVIYNNVKKKIVFYIHNIQFDGFIILDAISKYKEYSTDVLIKNNSIYYVSIKKNKVEILFKCSYKILPSSLKKISESFNLIPKMPFPYKFSTFENINYIGNPPSEKYFNNSEEYYLFIQKNKIFNFREYSISYCINDVLITTSFIKIITSIISKFKINLDKVYSAPSLSLKIFDHYFNNNKISFSTKDSFDSFIRPSYFGGRCEVYGNPYDSEKIFHFDFSGMYAQCMLQKFCFGGYKILKKPDNIEIPGFYWIKWRSIDSYLPILPHHNKKNGKLMFTNGILEGCYWFEEINEFLKNDGELLEIKSCLIFDSYDYIFKDFVNYFTEIRSISESHKIFGKLMINSLYGRMGMSDLESYSFIIKEDELDKYNSLNILSLKKINSLILLNVEIDNRLKKEFSNITKKVKKNISIASSITSKSRVKLYKAQKDVIVNGGRILYSDTDSIFAAYKKDVSNEKHGDVFWDASKKDTCIKDAVFMSPKSYSLLYKNDTEITKIKGFEQNSVKFNEIKTKFYNKTGDIIIENLRFIDKKNMKLYEKKVDKKLNLGYYDKREFNMNKKETKPLYTLNGLEYTTLNSE